MCGFIRSLAIIFLSLNLFFSMQGYCVIPDDFKKEVPGLKIGVGDLVEYAWQEGVDVIVHGCNCQNAMTRDAAGGLAGDLSERFPEIGKADKAAFDQGQATPGNFSVAVVPYKGRMITVINGYTQNEGGLVKNQTQLLKHIAQVFKTVKSNYKGKKIAIPSIGAGIAGGDWDQIYPVIAKELKGEDFTWVIHPTNGKVPAQFQPYLDIKGVTISPSLQVLATLSSSAAPAAEPVVVAPATPKPLTDDQPVWKQKNYQLAAGAFAAVAVLTYLYNRGERTKRGDWRKAAYDD